MRLDRRSVGDSDGDGNGLMPNEEYYQQHIYDDIEDVMQQATAQGARNSSCVTGHLLGAPTASYHRSCGAATDVRAIVLLNLLQLQATTPRTTRARCSSRSCKFARRRDLWLNPDSYRRLLGGKLPPNIKQALFSRAVVFTPLRKIASLLKRATKPGATPGESYIVARVQRPREEASSRSTSS